MKRYIVIGLGNFGSTVAARLYEMGHEVVALDAKADLVDSHGTMVTRALVGDATKRAVLEEAGARGADAAVIYTGDDLAASVLALLALRDLGVESIFVKVSSDEHARIAVALGAEEAIFPERESAMGLASRLTSGSVFKYVNLGPGLSLQEMAVPAAWRGRSLRDLELPQKHRVQVVAVHDVLRDQMVAVPDPDRPLTDSDTLILAGEPQLLEKLVERGR